MSKSSVIINLLKIQINDKTLQKRLLISFAILMSIALIFISKLKKICFMYGISLNIWDSFFTVILNPFFILYLYIPITIISSIQSIKLDCFYEYILMRISCKKYHVLISILYDLIMSLFINFIFFLSIILLSFTYFPTSFKWSNTLLNLKPSMFISNYLFPNNFVLELSPIQALVIAYIKFTLTIGIIFLIRDFLVYMIKSLKLAFLILILYISYNIWLFNFPVAGYIGKLMSFLSYNNLILLWYNKFTIMPPITTLPSEPITVVESLIVGSIWLVLLIILRILLSKRLVINNV